MRVKIAISGFSELATRRKAKNNTHLLVISISTYLMILSSYEKSKTTTRSGMSKLVYGKIIDKIIEILDLAAMN